MATPIVEPAPGVQTPQVDQSTPPAPPAPSAPAEEADQGLPDEIVQIPAVQAVLAGSPPAVSMHIKGADDRDEVKLLSENKDAMLAAGFDFYRSMSGELGVMFNRMRIHPEDLQAADKMGKLRAIAPDFGLVNHEVAKLGMDHPIHSATAPTGPASPMSVAPPQAASGIVPQAAPASVQRKLAQARIMNVQPGAPTSGAAPGGGRLLNSVLKQVV